jgi:hypothetical protein
MVEGTPDASGDGSRRGAEIAAMAVGVVLFLVLRKPAR